MGKVAGRRFPDEVERAIGLFVAFFFVKCEFHRKRISMMKRTYAMAYIDVI